MRVLLPSEGCATGNLSPMAAWLTKLGSGERWKLTTHLDNIVGRYVRARVRLALNSLGRKHTRLRWTPQGWEAADLGSSGGTFIAQGGAKPERIRSCILSSGDLLVYAGAQLQFVDDGQPPDESDSPAAMVRELLHLVESAGEQDRVMFLTSEVLQLRHEWGPLIEKLATAPDLENERARSLAAMVIGELSVILAGPEAERGVLVKALEQLASDAAPAVRVQALHELARLPETSAILRRALFDPDHAVFEAALQGLRRWKVSAVMPLEQLLETVSADRAERVAGELELERRGAGPHS